MPVRDTCRPSLRLVVSSGIAVSGNAQAASKSTTLQRDLACEAIFPWLVFALSTTAAVAVCMGWGLRLFAASTGHQGIPNTGSSYGSTKT
jgi:hypothetical protein